MGATLPYILLITTIFNDPATCCRGNSENQAQMLVTHGNANKEEVEA
jgi:hypothetical protein